MQAQGQCIIVRVIYIACRSWVKGDRLKRKPLRIIATAVSGLKEIALTTKVEQGGLIL